VLSDLTQVGIYPSSDDIAQPSPACTVEAHFYEGGLHGVTEFGNFQEDAIKRMIDFCGRYLK